MVLMISSWIIRKRNWKIPDLYVGNSSGIYWYTMGMNWRAFLAWTMGIWPSFRESSNFRLRSPTDWLHSWLHHRDWRRDNEKSCMASAVPDGMVCGLPRLIRGVFRCSDDFTSSWSSVRF